MPSHPPYALLSLILTVDLRSKSIVARANFLVGFFTEKVDKKFVEYVLTSYSKSLIRFVRLNYIRIRDLVLLCLKLKFPR